MSQDMAKPKVGRDIINNSTSIVQATDEDFLVHHQPFTYDAGSRVRVSQITTLFDGKTLNSDNPNLWHGVGSGTFSWANNITNMSVTAGQYYIRQSNRHFPYFSGKSQLLEYTMENFHLQVNVEKGFGHISSNSTAPYNTQYDGFAVVNTGLTYELRIYNNGTIVSTIDWTNWTNYNTISSYDFSKFSVFATDFLWLGGATLRLFIKTANGFLLLHTYVHAGRGTGVMIKSPNQPIRYWIRSSTGSGIFSPICSQCCSEGSVSEHGDTFGYYNTTAIACNTVGVIYALKSLKKQVTFRDMSVLITNFGLINSATTDAGIALLIKDPTLSSAISYTNQDMVQVGTPTNQTITAGTGTVLFTFPLSGSNGGFITIPENNSFWMQNKITDFMSEYVIAYMPITATQSLVATMDIKIF